MSTSHQKEIRVFYQAGSRGFVCKIRKGHWEEITGVKRLKQQDKSSESLVHFLQCEAITPTCPPAFSFLAVDGLRTRRTEGETYMHLDQVP